MVAVRYLITDEKAIVTEHGVFAAGNQNTIGITRQKSSLENSTRAQWGQSLARVIRKLCSTKSRMNPR
jgi:hypothetical protein